MPNLVTSNEYDTFMKDIHTLSDYQLVAHGKMIMNRAGTFAKFKVPANTAIVMFNLPGYLTAVRANTGIPVLICVSRAL